jgi:Cof subfamily protein (haloacid dehalogenase superfamily)
MMNSHIKLVVTDVDGTFLPKSREFSPATLAVVQQLHTQGVKLVLASSRPPRGMAHILEDAGISDPALPLVSMNGALISTLGGTTLFEQPLESRILLGIYGTVKDLLGVGKLNFMLLDAQHWWVEDCNRDGTYDDLVQREAWSLRMKPLVGTSTGASGDSKNDIHQRMLQPAHKITLLGQPELVSEAKERITRLYAHETTATSPANPKFLDITAAHTHKGTAVERLAAHLSLQREQICTIGDGENDVDMFRAVSGDGASGADGVSIAMAHASEAVRSAARFTAEAGDEGWAQAVERFVLA